MNQRSVKLGVQDGDKVAILDGLKPGDTVVVDGADRLRDGSDVTIPNPSPSRRSLSLRAPPAMPRVLRSGRRRKPRSPNPVAPTSPNCATARPGALRCGAWSQRSRDLLSGDCKTAMASLRRGAGGPPGGGFGGAP